MNCSFHRSDLLIVAVSNHRNEKYRRIPLLLAGWAFADSVLHRLAPLWVGARGLEFTWDYVLQGVEANANLACSFYSLICLLFILVFEDNFLPCLFCVYQQILNENSNLQSENFNKWMQMPSFLWNWSLIL